jgi:hypothetical protein
VITGLRRNLQAVAGVIITTTFTNTTLEADDVQVKINKQEAKSQQESELAKAGFNNAVVLSATAVTIADPTATPTPSPTLSPIADSKSGGMHVVLNIFDNYYASNNNLRFY